MTGIPDRPRRRPTVVLRELGTSAMLYDTAADRTMRLNTTARRIWELCDGSRDMAAIVKCLRAVLDAAAAPDLDADVRRTLQAFAGAGLLSA